MDGKIVKDENIANTSIHEGGHSAGLNHPWELAPIEQTTIPGLDQLNTKTQDKKMIKLNFMNSSENPNSEFLPKRNPSQILPGQIQTMSQNIDNKKLWSPAEVREGPKN